MIFIEFIHFYHWHISVAVSDSELCGICETMIQYLDSLLEENATVTEIEQALEKVCNFLPEGYAKQVGTSSGYFISVLVP